MGRLKIAVVAAAFAVALTLGVGGMTTHTAHADCMPASCMHTDRDRDRDRDIDRNFNNFNFNRCPWCVNWGWNTNWWWNNNWWWWQQQQQPQIIIVPVTTTTTCSTWTWSGCW
jgi:hypothetical protein